MELAVKLIAPLNSNSTIYIHDILGPFPRFTSTYSISTIYSSDLKNFHYLQKCFPRFRNVFSTIYKHIFHDLQDDFPRFKTSKMSKISACGGPENTENPSNTPWKPDFFSRLRRELTFPWFTAFHDLQTSFPRFTRMLSTIYNFPRFTFQISEFSTIYIFFPRFRSALGIFHDIPISGHSTILSTIC